MNQRLLVLETSRTAEDENEDAPFPKGAVRHITLACKVMVESNVAVNDLYAAALPNLGSWLLPGSVHCSSVGGGDRVRVGGTGKPLRTE